jgi:hypothetical protein
VLSDLGVAGNALPGAADSRNPQPSFAEGLGLWLDWTDAIALSAALHGDLPACVAADGAGAARRPAATAATAATAAAAAADALKRVRGDLLALATADVAYAAGATTAPADASVDLSACRRDHLAHQRAMESAIAPLRAQVRAALSRTSAEGARLAALDAVLDAALRPRERQLLAALPAWLEAHFAPHQPDDERTAEGQSLHQRYRGALQRVLLAELALRLEPVEGLMEALRHGATPTP